ncbi:MAG: nucleotidyltransferase [Acetatifactor sp.]|nr:nucleotidyltransferase [Acetatifactor sp.]
MISYSKEIRDLLENIEVADSEYEKAVKRYESLTSFIDDSDLKDYMPEIFLQGSFKLGTAIRPLTEDGSYDIDIVCKLNGLSKDDISQFALKETVGKVVKEYVSSNGMKNEAKNGKRCWTISYIDKQNFHVDILPAVPNNSADEIAITDKDNDKYYDITSNWEISNPKEYYEWFLRISEYEQHKRVYMESVALAAESVPYYKVKTPLQRIIQVLKRHAEVMFEHKMEFKPSSIIITTLSTKAYKDIHDIYDFWELLKVLISLLESKLDFKDGQPCVLNPIDKRENLSVKWKDDSRYYSEFLEWINQLKFDFSVESNIHNMMEQYSLAQRSLTRCSNGVQVQNALGLLPYHEKPKWELKMWKQVRLKATVYQKSFRPQILTSGCPVGKDAEIKFEAESGNIGLYEIYWQITNTGMEAQMAKQLRGDFYSSELEAGKKIRKENTRYIGKHYVEAFLVSDNVCVGRSEPFEVNIVKGAIVYNSK